MGLEEMLLVAARVMIASVFVLAGLRHRKLLAPLTQMLTAKGIPFPRPMLIFAVVSQFVGGITLALGIAVVPSAIGLILFTIIASLVLIDFWNAQGQQKAMMVQQIQLNIAVIGGLVLIVVASRLLPSTLWLAN